MARYIARRLVLLVIVLVGMSAITFSLTHLVPGDPARLLAGPHATQSQVESLARQFGLDRPVPEQYIVYVQGLLRGDLGMSLTTRRPVVADLAPARDAAVDPDRSSDNGLGVGAAVTEPSVALGNEGDEGASR